MLYYLIEYAWCIVYITGDPIDPYFIDLPIQLSKRQKVCKVQAYIKNNIK